MYIKLYSIPTCPYAKLIREFFTEKNLTYEDIDVTNEPFMNNTEKHLAAKMVIPVVDFNGAVVLGWNKPALEEVFNSSSQDGRKG